MGSLDKRTAALPSTADAVSIENQLIADDGQVLCLCLSDQHPIKWISLGPWKEARSYAVQRAHRKNLKSRLRQIFLEVPRDVGRGWEPSQTDFGRHFPCRGRAYNDCILFFEH